MPDSPSAQNLIRALIVLVVIGLICWLVLALLPLPYPFPQVIVAVAAIGGLVYGLRQLGLF